MSGHEVGSAEVLPKWRMRVAYDGRPFLGWQRQEQGMTVQEGLETGLATVLRHPVVCTGAGRTDTGVHARGQVVHFRSNAIENPFKVARGLSALVPEGISVRDLEPAPEDFSARYSALWREYCYRIRRTEEPLDPPNVWFPRRKWSAERLLEILPWFEREADFKSFCIPREDGRHTRCKLLLARGVEVPGGVDLWIRGDRFLHRMVRSIVGFAMDACQGRMGRDEFDTLISGTRIEGRFWAPPDGLTLERVGYPGWTEPAERGQPDARGSLDPE